MVDQAAAVLVFVSIGGTTRTGGVISRGGNSTFVRGVGYFKNKGSNRGLPGSQQCVCLICVPGPDSCVPDQINQSDLFLEIFIQ